MVSSQAICLFILFIIMYMILNINWSSLYLFISFLTISSEIEPVRTRVLKKSQTCGDHVLNYTIKMIVKTE
jgi:hypothetical protein